MLTSNGSPTMAMRNSTNGMSKSARSMGAFEGF